jgi:hypothetical protein
LPDSLTVLEQQRSQILTQFLQLGDFRKGSVTLTKGRCGKSNCHCHRSGEPASPQSPPNSENQGENGHGDFFLARRRAKGPT